MQYFGGIEAGGTKFVCAIGAGPNQIVAEERFPTAVPQETLAQAIAFFRRYQQEYPVAAIGISSFGPIDPNPKSPSYGYVTNTPKPGWANINFVGTIQDDLAVPVGFDTDVNGAAVGEHRWGAAQGLDTFVYLTIGTGLGGGGMVGGKIMHGLIHPEMGHFRIPHDWQADPYAGFCPYHGDCWEGLAAGPAINERWQSKGSDLPLDHPAWALEAHYLALGVSSIICILSPQRVIMGGGVMDQRHLFPLIHKEVQQILNGYIQAPELQNGIEQYIVPPGLGNQAGVLGSIALAEMALKGEL